MTTSGEKVITIIGATGIQGGSVVRIFQHNPPNGNTWRIKAVTRDVSSAKAKKLAAENSSVELVEADVGDLDSLKQAFQGSHVIFGMTDTVSILTDPKNGIKATAEGQEVTEALKTEEIRQGKNIFEAAASVPGLERLIFSSSTNVTKWSGGKYTKVVYNDAKALAAEWARDNLPELWAKTSIILQGTCLTNWLKIPIFKPTKVDNTFVFKYVKEGVHVKAALVAAEIETGVVTKALVEQAPGKNVAVYRELMSVSDYVRLWGEIVGVKTRIEYGDPMIPFPGDMLPTVKQVWSFADEFGFFPDPTVVQLSDLGIGGLGKGSVERWIKDQDWSELLEG